MTASLLLASSLAGPVMAEETTTALPPRRNMPLAIAGATGISAGLTMVAVSGIVAGISPCVTFPGLPSGCEPAFDNTYAAPLIVAGGILTVLSLPLLSIGLERDTGPLNVSGGPRIDVGLGSVALAWEL